MTCKVGVDSAWRFKDFSKRSCTKLCMLSPSTKSMTSRWEIRPTMHKVFGVVWPARAWRLIWAWSGSSGVWDPLNLGTSSFMQGGLLIVVFGVSVAEDEDGVWVWWTLFSRFSIWRIKASSFSLVLMWFQASLAIASSRRSRFDLEHMDSALRVNESTKLL